ncbi:hypothetical protein CRUP_011221 [Coryphaenoides rupestris]|nr:hypothetical protein CRUP_011221 [Coryphaenoides rupestris]
MNHDVLHGFARQVGHGGVSGGIAHRQQHQQLLIGWPLKENSQPGAAVESWSTHRLASLLESASPFFDFSAFFSLRDCIQKQTTTTQNRAVTSTTNTTNTTTTSSTSSSSSRADVPSIPGHRDDVLRQHRDERSEQPRVFPARRRCRVGCAASAVPITRDDPAQQSKRQGKVTVKYDRKELRKRLVLEEWIIEQLSDLYDCEPEARLAPLTDKLIWLADR